MWDSAILRPVAWTIALISYFPVSASAAGGSTTAPIDFVGRVVATDGKPILGARVSTYPISGTNNATVPLGMATTSDDGQFRIACPVGMVSVFIQASGFALDTRRVVINEYSRPFELEMKRGVNMRVTALNQDGKPLAGIRFAPYELVDRNPRPVGTLPRKIRDELARMTDETGACIFADMPRMESMRFEMTDPNYLNTSAFVYASNDALAEAPALRLQPAGTIEGILIDGATGIPVPNTTLSARTLVADGPRNAIFGGSATSDIAGRFQFIQLRAGDYSIMPTLSPLLASQRAAEPVGSVKVAPGQPVTNLVMNIVSGVTLRGKLTMQNGDAPVAGARIYVSQPGPLSTGITAMTDARGMYSLQLMPSAYQVVTTIGPISMQLAPPQTVTIAEGRETVLDIQAAPSRTPPLTGRVVDEHGQPIFRAQIILRMEDLIARGLTAEDSVILTDEDGRFIANRASNGMTLYARRGEARLAAPVTVNVTAGATRRGGPIVEPQTNLNLVLISNGHGEVVVHVVDENDKPVANALIRVYHRNDGADAVLARTAADGTLRVPGLYIDQYYVASTRPNGYAVGTLVPKPEAGKQIDAPPIKLIKADGFIAGILVDEQNQPLANAEISTLGGRSERQSVRTTEGGQFRMDNLVPGETLSYTTRIDAGSNPGTGTILVGTTDAVIMHKPFRPTTQGGRRGF